MAEFVTKCPQCSAELQAQNEWIGMEVECPECQKIFVIASPTVKVIQSAPNVKIEKIRKFLQLHKTWCIVAAAWLATIIATAVITGMIVGNSSRRDVSSYSNSIGNSIGSSGDSDTTEQKAGKENTTQSPEVQITKLINNYLSAAQKKSYALSQYFVDPSRTQRFEWIINSWQIIGPVYDKWGNDSNIIRVFIDLALPTGGNVKKSYQFYVKKHNGQWKISSMLGM